MTLSQHVKFICGVNLIKECDKFNLKVHVPVYKDRTKETTATLFDARNQVRLSQIMRHFNLFYLRVSTEKSSEILNYHIQVRHTFLARCHGTIDPFTHEAVNQLTTNGNTPTGLVVCFVTDTYG